jgi:hypothetical protein
LLHVAFFAACSGKKPSESQLRTALFRSPSFG